MPDSKKVVQMPAPTPLGRRKGRVKLTDAVVADFPLQGADRAFGPAEKYPAIYYDTELNGFHVLCHRTSKSYYVQHDVAGKSVIVCLGRTNQLTAQKARRLALAHILTMKDGINPTRSTAGAISMRLSRPRLMRSRLPMPCGSTCTNA